MTTDRERAPFYPIPDERYAKDQMNPRMDRILAVRANAEQMVAQAVAEALTLLNKHGMNADSIEVVLHTESRPTRCGGVRVRIGL